MNYYNQPNSNPPINLDQFRQLAPNLTEPFLNQLINQAKMKGISERDIKQGLEFIKNMK